MIPDHRTIAAIAAWCIPSTNAGIQPARSAPHVITIRTAYPYQTLQLVPENAGLPAFSLWVAYVPEDAEQRTNHVYGLLMIQKPAIPGALHLAWPLIRRFTERVFAEDRMAVEAEQRAWDEHASRQAKAAADDTTSRWYAEVAAVTSEGDRATLLRARTCRDE